MHVRVFFGTSFKNQQCKAVFNRTSKVVRVFAQVLHLISCHAVDGYFSGHYFPLAPVHVNLSRLRQ